MATPNPKRPRGQMTPPLRTIEDIERRAAEIRVAESYALATLVACMREIAVRCPLESQLAMQLAETAKSLNRWATRPLKGEEDAPNGVAATVGEHGTLGRLIRESMAPVGEEAAVAE
jgi:hypothetical protein